MRKVLTDLGTIDKYDFERPQPRQTVVAIETYDAVQRVLQNDDGEFTSAYGAKAREYIKDKAFFLPFDDDVHHPRDQRVVSMKLLREFNLLTRYHNQVSEALLADGGIERAAGWYSEKTAEFISERSYKLDKSTNKRYVDIVRDVLNILPIHWVSLEVGGLSLKTPQQPRGQFLESQLQQMLRDIYACVLSVLALNKAELFSQLDLHGDSSVQEDGARLRRQQPHHRYPSRYS